MENVTLLEDLSPRMVSGITGVMWPLEKSVQMYRTKQMIRKEQSNGQVRSRMSDHIFMLNHIIQKYFKGGNKNFSCAL